MLCLKCLSENILQERPVATFQSICNGNETTGFNVNQVFPEKIFRTDQKSFPNISLTGLLFGIASDSCDYSQKCISVML